jgi:WS/DGAT/MGAT family acyltransferase
MTREMVERQREPSGEREPMPAEPEIRLVGQGERFLAALGHERRRRVARALRSITALGEGLGKMARGPVAATRQLSETVASVGRLLAPVSSPLSPVMRGRSLRTRFDTLTFDLDPAKAAAKRVDGTVNDAFVAAICGGLRLYHEVHGEPVDELRMSMPINLREGEKGATAGNQFVPARFTVPVGIVDPRERMAEIRDRVRRQRDEPALPLVEEVSALLNRFPAAVATALFGAMLKGVDFTSSNVPGPRRDAYMSGARIDSIYGFGPLSGGAANITVFSYAGRLYMSIHTDLAAVPDSGVFLDCLERGLAEVLAVA